MPIATNEDCFKMNTLELAKQHRKHCNCEECIVSLQLLRLMAERAGVKFTDEEMEVFA